MKFYFFVALILVFPFWVLAATVHFNELAEPYAIFNIEEPLADGQIYYGSLRGYPDTYEFTITEETSLKLLLAAYADDIHDQPLSGILVRQVENGGVKEVGRMGASSATWEPYTDEYTALPYLSGPQFEGLVEPGTYRFEVSTPENVGMYKLQVGDGVPGEGYFENLSTVRQVHEYHNRSIFLMLKIPEVYLPFGILLLITLIFITFRYRKRSV